MLLSKAIRITDTVEATVTSHLPGALATPVHLAVAAVTWAPRHLVGQARPTASEPTAPGPEAARTPKQAPQPAPEETTPEPEVVLTLDRPAEEIEPPIDVVGEALRHEAAEQPPAHADEEHVEVEEAVVFSTSSEDGS